MLSGLDLLKSILTAELYDESFWVRMYPDTIPVTNPLKKVILRRIVSALEQRRYRVLLPVEPDKQLRERRNLGRDQPFFGFTMVGRKRLDNFEYCIRTAITESIEGSIVECGVWRGGASILAKAVLEDLKSNKELWLCDSFEGLPPPQCEQDRGYDFTPWNDYLGVSQDIVRRNFQLFGLLDERVKFLKGFFGETLRGAPIEKICVLRLDGDLYESTWQCLESLYPKVAPQGFIIIDDYKTLEPCRQAVHDYIRRENLRPEIRQIDGMGVYWRV
ncbi:MAG: macrocin O-methyltransferase [Acidobacteriia bacterium]|nr:macrocin O-methyltransferase [Terriglobia bacterium]